MKTEDEVESGPRKPGSDKARKKKRVVHIHIGPNKRAYSAGLAMCPVCDAEKICPTKEQRERAERPPERAPRTVPSPREPSKSYTRTKR